MIESITRKHTNFRRDAQGAPHEKIEFSYTTNGGPNLKDALIAARIMIDELADFEPPILGIDEGDIDFISNEHGKVQRLRFTRTDATTVIPRGYAQEGYVLPERTATLYNQIDAQLALSREVHTITAL